MENKKNLYIVIACIVAVLIGLGITLFIFNNKSYTVTFDFDNGQPVYVIKVEGDKVVLPQEPTKEGFKFGGWMLDGNLFDSNTKITKSITLKASWIPEEVKTVTIHFDSDGGSKVEDLIVNVGEAFTLPSNPIKEGYKFTKWVDKDGKEVDATKVFEKEGEVTLKAVWEKANATEFKITFDSKGGSKVATLTVKCGKTLVLPKSPTKEGYTFKGWEDKNNKVILNGAKLSCEDVTLYAIWEKVEEVKPVTPTPTPEPTKTYTCPTGYTLSGTKCTITEAVKTKCGERGFDYSGKCVTITYAARKEGEYGCPEKDIHVGSYAGKEKGEKVYAGTYFCYYHALSYGSQSQCESLSGQFGNFVWRPSNNTCYVTRTNAQMTCDNLSGYAYISNPNTYEGVNGLNGGCYPLSDKTKYCSDGFTLSDNKCVKTIDATLK